MDKKIRELKLDEVKAVAGGAYTISTSTTLSATSFKPLAANFSPTGIAVQPSLVFASLVR